MIKRTISPALALFCFGLLFPLCLALHAESPTPSPMEFIKKLKLGLFLAENNLVTARTLLEFKEEIGLSKEQEKKIEDLLLAYEESAIRSGAEVKIGELRFVSYLESEQIDRKEIARLIRQLSKQKTDAIVDYINYLLDIREILSLEQLEKAKIIREKEKKYHRKRFSKKDQAKDFRR